MDFASNYKASQVLVHLATKCESNSSERRRASAPNVSFRISLRLSLKKGTGNRGTGNGERGTGTGNL